MTIEEGARARLIEAGDDARLAVSIEPDHAGVRGALEASPFIELAEVGQAADVTLRPVDGGWAMVDDVHGASDGEPCFPLVPMGDAGTARTMLEHYYAYSAPL